MSKDAKTTDTFVDIKIAIVSCGYTNKSITKHRLWFIDACESRFLENLQKISFFRIQFWFGWCSFGQVEIETNRFQWNLIIVNSSLKICEFFINQRFHKYLSVY